MRTVQVKEKEPLVIVFDYPEAVFLFTLKSEGLSVQVSLVKVHTTETKPINLSSNLETKTIA
jgi:hypothetical protein